jgi:hypothetical protein
VVSQPSNASTAAPATKLWAARVVQLRLVGVATHVTSGLLFKNCCMIKLLVHGSEQPLHQASILLLLI